MNLASITARISRSAVFGSEDKEVTSLTVDSRKAAEGSMFFAIRGEKADGHDYIDKARETGCNIFVSEKDVPDFCRDTWIRVPDSRKAAAEAAAAYYRDPSQHLKLTGVTGTNGKTTTAFLLHHLITESRGRAGLIGTVKYVIGGDAEEPASRTTPDWLETQRLLAAMRDAGSVGCAMEVSSHALAQSRVGCVEFDAAIFTNLTQDHLDYHGSMEDYFMAKAAFFEHLINQGGKKKPCGVVNTDDIWGQRLVRLYEGKLPLVKFGMGVHADFRATDVHSTVNGTTFNLEARGRQFLVRLPLIGRFNVYNALGAIAAAWSMDFNLRETVLNIAKAPQVPGRLQLVPDSKGFRVFVDYAHTPDALDNALRTVKALGPRRLICVFGCGGDRDRFKRPLMGGISEQYADWTIVTSDNPRSEDPDRILADIRGGMKGAACESIIDRRAAIARAVEMAGPGDIVVIAGKGHEAEQVFATERVEFDDVKVARSAILSARPRAQNTTSIHPGTQRRDRPYPRD